MRRRDFLRTAGGASAGTAALGVAGPAAAQENGTGGSASAPPDYGGWLDDADNFDGTTENLRGQDTVTVEVGTEGNGGPNAFSPPAIHVDVGTTVQFEWTGNGFHNVQADNQDWNSGDPVSEAGVNYEHTFDSAGIVNYYCNPHLPNGMKGSVVVGDDYPTVDTGGGERTEVDPEHMGVPYQAHFVGLATIVAILVSLVFTFFQLKYGESPNTKGGNN